MAIDFDKMAQETAEDIVALVGKGKAANIEGRKITLPAAAPDPLNLERAIAPFKKYEVTLAEWKKRAAALVITDETSLATATEMAAQVAGIVKKMVAEEKQTISRPDSFVKGIRTFFRKFKNPLEGIKTDLKGKVGDYSYQQELKRRADEKKAQEAQAKLQAEMDAAAAKHNIEPVKMPEMVAPKKAAPVRTESGSSSVRYKWTFEIITPALVPDRFMVVDDKAIQQAIDAGLRDITGIKIFEKPIVSVRGGDGKF